MHDTTLLQLIEDDIAPATQLLELLRVESNALFGRDMLLLETILAKKQSLVVQLEQRGRKRSQVLAAMGFSADRAGLRKLAESHAQGAHLLQRSELLSSLLADCQTINELNGHSIAHQQNTTATQIRILMGGEAPSLYDSRGSTSRLAKQRPLSQA
jgi:flagella synthesis protein FlgN